VTPHRPSSPAQHWEAASHAASRTRIAAAVVALGVGAAVTIWATRVDDTQDGSALPVEQADDADPAPRPRLPAAEDDTGPAEDAAQKSPRAWRTLPRAPIQPRFNHEAVWTGPCANGSTPPACGEMIVWGGYDDLGWPIADGAAYDPERDTWRRIPAAPATLSGPGVPPARWAPAATPDEHGELLAWPVSGTNPTGIAYEPASGAWRELSPAPLEPRIGHALAWTGRELVVWGGREIVTRRAMNDGAAYDPRTDSWRLLGAAPLDPRHGPGSAAVDGEVVIWGGVGAEPGTGFTDGAVYNPDGERWTPLPALPQGLSVTEAQAVPRLEPIGDRLILNQALRDSDGAQFLAVLDHREGVWELTAWPEGLRRQPHLAAGPASTVLLWGGTFPADGPPLDGALWDVRTDTWTELAAVRSPLRCETALWTGREFVMWGSLDRPWFHSNEGMALDPEALSAEHAD
jgi:hypothetical protein